MKESKRYLTVTNSYLSSPVLTTELIVVGRIEIFRWAGNGIMLPGKI